MILKFFLSICRKFCLTVLIQVFLLSTYPQQKFFAQRSISNNLGIFSGNADVGNIGIPGSATFNSDDSSYIISGSGENMWFGKDAFHFVNIMAYGNIALEADISWIGDGTNPHRKAGVIIRQNLNPGSIYADAIVHGDGLTSLQYREAEDSMTYEIRAGIEFPSRLRIKKVGKYISMEYGFEGESYQPSGASVRLVLEDPFYIGLGVCSHEDSVLEKAVFRNVKYEHLEIENNMKIRSTLETINIESKNRQVIYTADRHFEAPNWSGDNSFFIFNSEGLLYRLPSEGGIPQVINTDFAVNCNNDHGLSPDNSQIVISDQTMGDKQSRIYILPAEGGTPKLITPNAPSYWHGWSPDGRMLAYCAERNGQYDIYAIPVNGGDERQLTFSEGLDDGPDYSPDGKYIYFNSVRTGTMQIWRMTAEGEDQTQITFDEFNDWFPHPSPDGKWLVFLSYEKDVQGHPPNRDVMLRILSLESGKIEILTKLFGGQGTLNVPSWSPDSKHVAFVSYSN